MKGLDRTQLKFIAICGMVCDHAAWGFVEFMTPLGQIMHIIGRLTLPIMCFFIAEGFRHTSNIKGTRHDHSRAFAEQRITEVKKGQINLLTQTSEGEWKVPPSLFLARKLYIF